MRFFKTIAFVLTIGFVFSGALSAQDFQQAMDTNPVPVADDRTEKDGEWINYYEAVPDGEINDNALGVAEAVEWNAAIRWSPEDLAAYEGWAVTKIRVFMNDEPTSAVAKIWQGDISEPVEMISQAMMTAQEDWVEVELFDPYMIDTSQELWIGWEMGDPGDGLFPAAFTTTDAFTPMSDLLQLGDDPWGPAADFGFDVAWNIEAFVEPLEDPDPDFYSVTFNVDMTDVEGFDPDEHHVFISGSFLDWPEPGTEESIQMELVDPAKNEGQLIYTATEEAVEEGLIEYKYFSDAIDEGWDGGEWEGDPNREAMISDDTVLNDVWGDYEVSAEDIDMIDLNLSLYPNPATSHININVEGEITEVRIFDISGRMVLQQEEASTTLNLPDLHNGMYILQVTTNRGVESKRFQIVR